MDWGPARVRPGASGPPRPRRSRGPDSLAGGFGGLQRSQRFSPGRLVSFRFRIKQRVLSVAHRKPADLNDLERHALVENDRFAGRSKELRRAFCAESEDTIRIRAAFQNFARASLDPEPGEAFLRLAMCLGWCPRCGRRETPRRASARRLRTTWADPIQSAGGRELSSMTCTELDRSTFTQVGSKGIMTTTTARRKLPLVRAILRREIRELPDPPPETVEGDGPAESGVLPIEPLAAILAIVARSRDATPFRRRCFPRNRTTTRRCAVGLGSRRSRAPTRSARLDALRAIARHRAGRRSPRDGSGRRSRR